MEMDFGWVDYSANEQKKVLKTLDDLNDDALDALGLSVISDHYAGTFFPGISTAQRRARDFVFVPYIFKKLKDCKKLKTDELEKEEKDLAKQLYQYNEKESFIGKRWAQSNGKEDWLTRTLSDIYWTGLKKFKILKPQYKNYSKQDLLDLLNNRDPGIKEKNDDFSTSDASEPWDERIETLYREYRLDKDEKKYSILPTESEAKFLKNRICKNVSGSLLAALLERGIQLKGFKELEGIIKEEDEFKHFRTDFDNAVRFSKFAKLLNAYYIYIISNRNSRAAQDILTKEENKEENKMIVANFKPDDYTYIRNSQGALIFLQKCKKCLTPGNNGIEKVIIDREQSLKGSQRAKTSTPKEEYKNKSVSAPDFRYGRAKVIINDILKG